MWQIGQPTEQGSYLCAWKMGVEYVYGVCKWEDNKWKPYPVGIPDTWKVIESPQAQNDMLDTLYEYAK